MYPYVGAYIHTTTRFFIEFGEEHGCFFTRFLYSNS